MDGLLWTFGEKLMRTKTYIAFDGDTDIGSYRLLKAWSANKCFPFSLNDAHDVNNARDGSLPDSIKQQLQARLDKSKHLILIIGDSTNRNRRGILQYEINYALRNKLPIFLLFKGFKPEHRDTPDLWKKYLLPRIPAVLKNHSGVKYCLVSPFTQKSAEGLTQKHSHLSLPGEGYTWHWH